MGPDVTQIRAESRRWAASLARQLARQLNDAAAAAAAWGITDLPNQQMRTCADALTRWADEQDPTA